MKLLLLSTVILSDRLSFCLSVQYFSQSRLIALLDKICWKLGIYTGSGILEKR